MKRNGKKFPKGFYFGASTSAHQVEGGNKNDFTEQEKEVCDIRAKNYREHYTFQAKILGREPDWKSIEKEASDPKNYISGLACDHYNLYEKDFDLACKLGHNSHRFSIEWARIEPKEGKFDKKELLHYKKVVKALRKRGIEPFVTLWHFSLPIWFQKSGGWLRKDADELFTRYVEKVVSYLKDDVKYWMTLNEPMVWAADSYLLGIFPPEKKSFPTFLKILYRLGRAHISAYKVIKEIDENAQVGLVIDNPYFEPYKNRLYNRVIKFIADHIYSKSLLFYVRNSLDFIGLNHYFHNVVNFGFNKKCCGKINDMGIEMHPKSMYHAIMELCSFHKPVYVTESGTADREDKYRAWYIREILKNVLNAIHDGADVKGYFHWSLLDNYEWDKGYWPKMGLIKVNFDTLAREVRDSAYTYTEIIKNNGF